MIGGVGNVVNTGAASGFTSIQIRWGRLEDAIVHAHLYREPDVAERRRAAEGGRPVAVIDQ
jgi:hypothetical protein